MSAMPATTAGNSLLKRAHSPTLPEYLPNPRPSTSANRKTTDTTLRIAEYEKRASKDPLTISYNVSAADYPAGARKSTFVVSPSTIVTAVSIAPKAISFSTSGSSSLAWQVNAAV